MVNCGNVQKNICVSVPIRGLFNLTTLNDEFERCQCCDEVSVPIRGLFNLTKHIDTVDWSEVPVEFPSPLGDYLI